jgi:hypothetical protein
MDHKMRYSVTTQGAGSGQEQIVNSIRVERDPAFWREVFDHPEVGGVLRGYDVDIGPALAHDAVIPFASQHGGYLFVRLDVLSRVYEIHAAYTPEGRGREAHEALKEALETIKADVIVAMETDNPMSRPPLTFGFRAVGEFEPSPIGDVRTWVLTRDAWEASQARRRMH